MDRLIDYLPQGLVNNLNSHQRAFLRQRRIGRWQTCLLQGKAPWDGRGLRGKAASYASKYRRAAMRLFSDLRLALRGSQYYPAIVPGVSGPRLEITTMKAAVNKKRRDGVIRIGYNEPYAIVRHSNDYLRPLFLKAVGSFLERKSDRARVKNFGVLRLALVQTEDPVGLKTRQK